MFLLGRVPGVEGRLVEHRFQPGRRRASLTGWAVMPVLLSAIALVVSYFSGPMLNYGDFSRYGRISRPSRGQLPGLPVNFLVFSLLAVITAAATRPVFGELIIDPVQTVGPDRQRVRGHARRADLHDRHRRHQHRRQLRLAGVRLLQREPAEDQLADGRHDRRGRLGADHPVEPVQQPARRSTTRWTPWAPSSVRSTGC